MRKISKIIVHCSASDFPGQDSLEKIRELHVSNRNKLFTWGRYQANGKDFSDIGYHFVILQSGEIKLGRPLAKPGAHCFGHNSDSVGICLTGEFNFSKEQFESLGILIDHLRINFEISLDQVFPHSHFNKDKSCPNFKLSEHLLAFKDDNEAL